MARKSFFCYNGTMFLAIDIGGTKTLLALFSSHGLCLKRLKYKTASSQETFVKNLQENLQSFIPAFLRRHIKAITVAIPGVIKKESNSYSFKFGNLSWPNIDLVSPIKQLFDVKIFFLNDASLATLYEASRLKQDSLKTIYLTFSTGIGGGIFQNGKLQKASETFEPGHVKYSFNGQRLEWEDIASAKAINTFYNTTINFLSIDALTLDDLIARLSLGLLDIINAESPDSIIIGGPLALRFDDFAEPLTTHLRSLTDRPINLIKAHRPTESVIYGAYLYSKQNS